MRVHVFTTDMPLIDNPRHAPTYSFTHEQLIATLDENGIERAVTAAASPWGDYNDYILAAVRAHPKRLRGTAIVKPTVDRFALEEMSRAGIIGIRLPFIGLPALPDITTFEYRALFCRLADLGWHVHPRVDGDDLPKILPTLETSGVKIVVDHLGRPNPRDGINSNGFKASLRSIDKGRTWVKASGGYRLGPASVASSSAKARPYLSVAVEIELHGSFTENLGAGRRVGTHSLSQSIVARYGNWPSWPTNGQSLAHTKRSGAGGAQKLARVSHRGRAEPV
ncbi:MAG: amidohydrolase family protein, partial [Xanthobacteraceae bacterium]